MGPQPRRDHGQDHAADGLLQRPERGDPETFNRDGYDYVCKRIRSPETTAQELSDLKKVKRAYDLMDEFRQLVVAAQRGNWTKVNAILSKGAMA